MAKYHGKPRILSDKDLEWLRQEGYFNDPKFVQEFNKHRARGSIIVR